MTDHPPGGVRRPRFPGLAGAIGLLGMALGAQFAAAAGWKALAGPDLDLVWLSGLANLTGLSAVAALGYAVSGQGPRLRPLVRVSAGFWGGVVATAAGGTVVLGEVANVVALGLPVPDALASVFNSLTQAPLVASLFTLVVVAPVTEEALFRGLLLRGFARRWGWGPGLALSSALFALFHLNVWQAVPAFVAGVYLGALYRATGSLGAPMVAHAVFNGLPTVAGALGLTVMGYNTPVGTPGFQPWPWTLGGAALVVGGLVLTKPWGPAPNFDESAAVRLL